MNRPSFSSVAIAPASPEAWDNYDRRYQFSVITPGQGAILRHPETGRYIPVWVNEAHIIADRGDGFRVRYGLDPLTEYDWGADSEFCRADLWEAEYVTPAPFLEFADVTPAHLRDNFGTTD